VTDETMVEEPTDEQATVEEQTTDEQATTEQPAAEEAAEDTVSEAAAETPDEATDTVSEANAAPAEEEAAPARRSSSRKKADAVETDAAPSAALGVNGLMIRYREEVIPALTKEFGYTNPNQVPRLSKIVVNIGLGEALTNAKALDAAVGDLAQITGQKPIVTRARRSIAQFRLRTGNPIGAKVTLRGQRMWDFLERLTRLALPRIRDFRGVPSKSFDGRGNYSLGLREQLAFPEIDYDKIDRLRGLEVSIVTTAKTDEESKRLLQLLGMPFAGQSN
jgi:large subunit ribosomal protein L5